MNDIPSDLAEAVRHAAAAVPDERHSLADVHRRRRRHQRRRVATVAGVAVLAVAAGVPLLVNRSGPAPEPFATASATVPVTVPAGPAQRLLLGNGYYVIGNVGVRGPRGIAEVDASGGLFTRPVLNLDSADSVVGLPDGRLVMLGPVDLKPGVSREDGPNVTDLAIRLVVTTAAGGGPEYEENVRIVGETVRLIGATATGAYLLRDGKRVAFHEFGSGTERPMPAASSTVVAAGDPDRFDVSVQGDRLLLTEVADDGSARLRVHDLATGADLLGGPVTVGAPGTAVRAVRLSPDGRHVAVGLASQTEYMLATVPVAAAPRVRNTVLGSTGDNRKAPGDVQGIAFTDDRTVRVAWYVLPPGADRVYDLAEVLKVSTVTV